MTHRTSEPTTPTPTLAIVSGGAGFMLLVVGFLLLHENQEAVRAFLRDAPVPAQGGVLGWWRHLAPVHAHLGWGALGAAMVSLVGWLAPRWHARYAPRRAGR